MDAEAGGRIHLGQGSLYSSGNDLGTAGGNDHGDQFGKSLEVRKRDRHSESNRHVFSDADLIFTHRFPNSAIQRDDRRDVRYYSHLDGHSGSRLHLCCRSLYRPGNGLSIPTGDDHRHQLSGFNQVRQCLGYAEPARHYFGDADSICAKRFPNSAI
jgi:hypothetical protein